MRMLQPLLVALTAATVGGCIESTAIIKVNADGSGTLAHRTLMNSAALAQMRQVSGALGGRQVVDPFSEEQARALAGSMGDAVTLVSSTPIAGDSTEGRASLYAFKDVRKLQFKADPMPTNMATGGGAVGPQGGANALTFDLALNSAGNAVLTLHMPNSLVDSLVTMMRVKDSSLGASPLQIFRQTLIGLRLALRIEPGGSLVRTTSPYVDGKAVTLFDMSFDDLANDDTVVSRVQEAKTTAEAKAVLKEIPGFKVNFDSEVTIEFTPAR